MTTTLVATLDGCLHDPGGPLVRADDLGLLRGDGVFEATLVVDGVPRDLDEHLARFAVSARMIDLELPSAAGWCRGIEAVVASWRGDRQMALRLVCTRGPESGGPATAFVIGSAANPHIEQERRDGVGVVLLDRGFAGEQIAAMPWLLPGAKTLSYAINLAAKRYAEAHGAADVIFVGTDGAVLEGPTSTVVIARGRTLVTPPTSGILAGVTVKRLFRDAVAGGWETQTAALTPPDLRSADGLWLVSGVRLLAPVVTLDGRPLGIGAAHDELARVLQVP